MGAMGQMGVMGQMGQMGVIGQMRQIVTITHRQATAARRVTRRHLLTIICYLLTVIYNL